MPLDTFLQKLVAAVGMLKIPAIIIIMVIALIQAGSAVFIGGQDKRTLFSTIIGLILLATLIFYVDRLVIWVSNFMR